MLAALTMWHIIQRHKSHGKIERQKFNRKNSKTKIQQWKLFCWGAQCKLGIVGQIRENVEYLQNYNRIVQNYQNNNLRLKNFKNCLTAILFEKGPTLQESKFLKTKIYLFDQKICLISIKISLITYVLKCSFIKTF